jgi:RNA polymerase sigma factor for flagellar operon FliA
MRRLPPADLPWYWRQFQEQGSQAARGRLIEHFSPLVPATLRRTVPNVPATIDPEELESEGYLALVRAVDRFEPDRGVQFTSYAINCIRGAMLQWLRVEDWRPRLVRTQQRQLAAVRELGLTDAEQAARLSLSLDQFYTLEAQAQERVFYSIDEPVSTTADEIAPLWYHDIHPDPDPGPEALYLTAWERQWWREQIQRLPATAARLFVLRYWHGRSFTDVAPLLGIRPDYAGALHKETLQKLRQLAEAP